MTKLIIDATNENFFLMLIDNKNIYNTSHTNSKFNYEKLMVLIDEFLTIISPIIPHFTSECLTDLKLNPFQKWPEVDKNLIKNDTVEYVIQINGKKRATIKFMKDVEKEKLLEEILQNEKTKKFFENEKIKKYFFVKNRLINILI